MVNQEGPDFFLCPGIEDKHKVQQIVAVQQFVALTKTTKTYNGIEVQNTNNKENI